jgi:hypothetical protein
MMNALKVAILGLVKPPRMIPLTQSLRATLFLAANTTPPLLVVAQRWLMFIVFTLALLVATVSVDLNVRAIAQRSLQPALVLTWPLAPPIA